MAGKKCQTHKGRSTKAKLPVIDAVSCCGEYRAIVVEYVSKDVVNDTHTNSIESLRALFKRGYVGTYRLISKKCLQRYVDEFVTRLHCHRNEFGNFEKFAYTIENINSRLSYKGLING